MSVPAAVYVITAEDIRRSGATSLPRCCASRLGMQVARIDAGLWSIGIGASRTVSRGPCWCSSTDARCTRRSSPGPYWEAQDVLLDDIERIEVIRGPGGTLWGSNAVNGIISIVTRSARETQGRSSRGRWARRPCSGRPPLRR